MESILGNLGVVGRRAQLVSYAVVVDGRALFGNFVVALLAFFFSSTPADYPGCGLACVRDSPTPSYCRRCRCWGWDISYRRLRGRARSSVERALKTGCRLINRWGKVEFFLVFFPPKSVTWQPRKTSINQQPLDPTRCWRLQRRARHSNTHTHVVTSLLYVPAILFRRLAIHTLS